MKIGFFFYNKFEVFLCFFFRRVLWEIIENMENILRMLYFTKVYNIFIKNKLRKLFSIFEFLSLLLKILV